MDSSPSVDIATHQLSSEDKNGDSLSSTERTSSLGNKTNEHNGLLDAVEHIESMDDEETDTASESYVDEDYATDSGSGTESEQTADEKEKSGKSTNFGGWMGALTKKTLKTLSTTGSDILSAPGKKYRQYQESHEDRRKRAIELEKLLESLSLDCSDVAIHSQTLALRAGKENRLIGTDEDLDLIRIRWYRYRPVIDGVNVLYSDKTLLENVTHGFYTPSADDIGCRIGAKVELTERALFGITGTAPSFEAGMPMDSPLVSDPDIKAAADCHIRDGSAVFEGIRLANDPLSTASIHISLVQGLPVNDSGEDGKSTDVANLEDGPWLELKVYKVTVGENASQKSDEETDTEIKRDETAEGPLVEDSESNGKSFSQEPAERSHVSDMLSSMPSTPTGNHDKSFGSDFASENGNKTISTVSGAGEHDESVNRVPKVGNETSESFVDGNENHASSKRILQLEGRFPVDRLRICLRASDPFRFSLHVGEKPKDIMERGPDRYRLQLSASSPVQRDVIALTLRGLRDRVHFLRPQQDFPSYLPYQYDYPPKRSRAGSVSSVTMSPSAAAKNSPTNEEQATLDSSSANTGSWGWKSGKRSATSDICTCSNRQFPRITLAQPKDNKSLCACSCMYPSVYFALKFQPLIFDGNDVKNDMHKSQSSSTLHKVTSYFSNALGKKVDIDKERASSPEREVTKADSETDSVSPLDLYATAGCSTDRVAVTIELADGESLGVTFGLRHLMNGASSRVGDPTIVYVSAFCGIGTMQSPSNESQDTSADGQVASPSASSSNGEEVAKGQLELSGKVRVGDVLVAVGGEEVQPPQENGTEYIPCTLHRVSELVQKWRDLGRDNNREKSRLELTFALPAWKPPALVPQDGKLRSNVPGKFWPFGHSAHHSQASPTSLSETSSDHKVGNETRSTPTASQDSEDQTVIKHIEEAKSHFKKELRKKEQAMKQLCVQLETTKKNALEAETERSLVFSERDALRRQVKLAEAELDKVKSEAGDLKRANEKLGERCSGIEKELKERNSLLSSAAGEAEGWEGRLAAKEEALRKMDAQFRASQLSKDNLQSVLDGSLRERNLLESEVKELQQALHEYKEANSREANQLAAAHAEADRLTAELHQLQGRLEYAESRGKEQVSESAAELKRLRRLLEEERTRASALEEATAGAKARADGEAAARREAEDVARSAREGETQAIARQQQAELMAQEARTQLEQRIEEDRAARDRDELVQAAKAEAARAEEERALVVASNDDLVGQNRSLKAKVQSMQLDVAKMAQLDSLKENFEELVVQYHMEKAARQELEDDLLAYKKALREASTAEPGKAPKIFAHLVKQLKKEDGAAKR